jgi:hypothetical protein
MGSAQDHCEKIRDQFAVAAISFGAWAEVERKCSRCAERAVVFTPSASSLGSLQPRDRAIQCFHGATKEVHVRDEARTADDL